MALEVGPVARAERTEAANEATAKRLSAVEDEANVLAHEAAQLSRELDEARADRPATSSGDKLWKVSEPGHEASPEGLSDKPAERPLCGCGSHPAPCTRRGTK